MCLKSFTLFSSLYGQEAKTVSLQKLIIIQAFLSLCFTKLFYYAPKLLMDKCILKFSQSIFLE